MKNLAFFGGGNIAQSIIKGLINSGYSPKNIFFVDRNSNNQKALNKLGIKKLSGAKNKIDLHILAVKPKDATAAFQTILKENTKPKIVSLVAGVKTKRYKSLGKNIEIMRAMPNTSSKYGLGITAVYNSSFKQTDLSRVIKLFEKIGIVITLKEEKKIDTFTGMIGSGPAYFFLLMQSLKQAALALGLDEKTADSLSIQTSHGASIMATNSGKDSKTLRSEVTSPCLLYTSPSPRDRTRSRMPSSA